MTTAPERPAPERFLSLIREQERGRLKIYLGFAPGVGKTYEMLQEGQRLRREKVDAVVGIVETHGRTDTAALIGDLEQIPRRRIEYHGVVLEEMDIDAVLARKPKVCLVDELAHTNAPGSRHAKRYQDVEELLANGINVISTLNVQHLESLYDIIEQFAGVKVKERVPDYVLGLADQIVNVDLSAEDLQDRLRAGKVYPSERVQSALTNFFTSQNLTRLRELALEEIANILDRRRQARKEEPLPGGAERVMVCLSSRSPNPHRLLRKGARVADRMRAPWYAVYIHTPAERLEKIDAATGRRIADTQALAHQLGAVPLEFGDGKLRFAEAVSLFVREYGITHVVVGRSQRPWYQRWFGRSPLERLFQAAPGVDVLVVDTA